MDWIKYQHYLINTILTVNDIIDKNTMLIDKKKALHKRQYYLRRSHH